MTWLERLEADKARSVAVFAGSGGADAVRAFIAAHPDHLLHLAFSDQMPEPVIDRGHWPPNVKALSYLRRIDPDLLAAVARMVWFGDGCRWSRLTVALGQWWGLPLDCIDGAGAATPEDPDGQSDTTHDHALKPTNYLRALRGERPFIP